mmetsp:Transcript_12051/g.17671  ORF Transcript_12051/g.17671 Transcript_12051/m.17671 type:complete len:149 (+) Transcript_12051:93-539(+)
MARSRRGGGGGFGRSKPAARRPAPVPAPRPAAQPPAPQQASSGGGMLSGIGSTIAQGMAFGTGSAIAHQAVGAVAGSLSGGGAAPAEQQYNETQPMAQQQQPIQGSCAQDKQMFFECLQVNKGDQQACSFLYENLQACQRSDSPMQFS